MTRTTESNVYSAFIMLANALDKPVYIGAKQLAKLKKANPYFIEPKKLVTNYLTVGAWVLQNYPNWRIVEIFNDGGAESHPLGNECFKASEFYDVVHFALRVLHLKGAHND